MVKSIFKKLKQFINKEENIELEKEINIEQCKEENITLDDCKIYKTFITKRIQESILQHCIEHKTDDAKLEYLQTLLNLDDEHKINYIVYNTNINTRLIELHNEFFKDGIFKFISFYPGTRISKDIENDNVYIIKDGQKIASLRLSESYLKYIIKDADWIEINKFVYSEINNTLNKIKDNCKTIHDKYGV